MKLVIFALMMIFAVCAFAETESQTLFDSKEVNLDKNAEAKAGAALAGVSVKGDVTAAPAAAADSASGEKTALKESEVPVHFDAVKEKASEKQSLPRVLISLVVVFALLGGATFALKKWTKKRSFEAKGMQIRVLTQHHLGPKKSIAIIQVAGESILIGVTDHNISMLKTLALIDDEIPAGEPNKFNEALYEYEEEEGEIGKHFSQKVASESEVEPDDFALRGISEIRDVVSKRLKGMRQIE